MLETVRKWVLDFELRVFFLPQWYWKQLEAGVKKYFL